MMILTDKLHIYHFSLTGKNLEKTATIPAEFSGTLGFTWKSVVLRINKKWKEKFMDSIGVKYEQGKGVKFSVLDTKLQLTIDVNGNFSTRGKVNIFNAGDSSFARINGNVTYISNSEALFVAGSIDIAGFSYSVGEFGLYANVISVKNTVRLEAVGTFKPASWITKLSGRTFFPRTGNVCLPGSGRMPSSAGIAPTSSSRLRNTSG